MNGDEVFDQMAQKYSECKTYSDAGRVEGTLGLVTFKTYFVRPDKFRFEFKQQARNGTGSAAIWTKGNRVCEFYDYEGKVELRENLSAALAIAGGASQGASYLVPTLLMPDQSGKGASLWKLQPYIFAEHRNISERNCHRLCSTNEEAPFTAELWIDKLGLKLRKLEIEFQPSTPEERAAYAEARQRDPIWIQSHVEELAKQLSADPLSSIEATVAQTTYTNVAFDREIPDDVFDVSP